MQFKKVVQRILFMAMVFALPVSAHAANVIADGKEWRQVTDTVNTSWNTLAASCDTTSGVCGGAYAGWTWASFYDVYLMFEDLLVPQYLPSSPGPAIYNSLLPAEGILNHFAPTYLNHDSAYLVGWARDGYPGSGLVPYLHADYNNNTTRISYSEGQSASLASFEVGAWMYTTAAPVPEPEIYAMMGLGLGLMGWAGRRKQLKEAQSA